MIPTPGLALIIVTTTKGHIGGIPETLGAHCRLLALNPATGTQRNLATMGASASDLMELAGPEAPEACPHTMEGMLGMTGGSLTAVSMARGKRVTTTPDARTRPWVGVRVMQGVVNLIPAIRVRRPPIGRETMVGMAAGRGLKATLHTTLLVEARAMVGTAGAMGPMRGCVSVIHTVRPTWRGATVGRGLGQIWARLRLGTRAHPPTTEETYIGMRLGAWTRARRDERPVGTMTTVICSGRSRRNGKGVVAAIT